MPLRYRQVHLDFHTSPEIPGIGTAFDKKEFQDTLQKARVNSITCFSKCHHGWSYHPTRIGKMHPHLEFDLLRAQFDACGEIDVNVPVYISAGLDNMITQEHPEWREFRADGGYPGGACNPVRAGFHRMCFNGPYLDYLCDQIVEAVRLFPDCHGIFLDIISQNDCCCPYCLRQMKKEGLDPTNPDHRWKVADTALQKYFKQSTAAARVDNPDMPVFHNSGHIQKGNRKILEYFSHLELESLPTGGWGYDHFPLSAKYCTGLDMDFLGMTGKFHTSWGEFGGFKPPNALRYECAAMVAFGAKCSVGDQLHPNGQLDKSTYSTIGAAYAEVEAKEPWLDNAESVADIGLFSSESVNRTFRCSDPDEGAVRLLLEGHFLFDVLDADMDFTKYKMLILPDDIHLSPELTKRITAYLNSGGKLMMTGESGLTPDKNGFQLDIGCSHEGTSPFQPDFIRPDRRIAPDFVTSPFVMYLPSQRIKAKDAESLGNVFDPYFNRNVFHFCSHQHAPNQPEPSGYDCGALHKNILYLAHPVFRTYRGSGAVALKQYVINAMNLLLGNDATVRTSMPSTGRITLNHQPAKKRYILHLLYANTLNRGGHLNQKDHTVSRAMQPREIIEELLPLHNTDVSLSLDNDIRRAVIVPEEKEISIKKSNGLVELSVDEFTCHAMIALEY